MFKRFFGKSEKEKEEERLRRELEAEKGRREQSVADQRIALKAATKPLQLVVDGCRFRTLHAFATPYPVLTSRVVLAQRSNRGWSEGSHREAASSNQSARH